MGSQPQKVVRPLIPAAHVESILASPQFVRSQRMCRFLLLLVQRANQRSAELLKETEIGVLVFDREVGYDPKIDSIVRTEATRLRRKLLEYYAGEGRTSTYRLHLPPGRYVIEVLPNVQPVAVEAQISRPAPGRRDFPYRWVVVGMGSLILVVAWLIQVRSPRLPTVTPLTFFPGVVGRPSFAPDGKRVAYTWDGETGGVNAIYIQPLNSETPNRLTRSSVPEYSPAWSPDGTEIAFLRQVESRRIEVRQVRVASGTETLVAAIAIRPESLPALDWSPDGAYLATSEPSAIDSKQRLILISARTGEKRVFRESRQLSYSSPVFSPDGRSLAYTKHWDTAVSNVFVAGFPTGPDRQATFENVGPFGYAWSGPRELIFSSNRGGARASLWRLPLGGTPLRLTPGGEDSTSPAVSRDGTLVAFKRPVEDINIWRRRLAESDPANAGSPWLVSSRLDSSPQWAPDASRVAFRSSRTGSDEVWTADRDGRSPVRLTHFNGPLTGAPRWSPDGKWIAFDSRASGNADIWVMAAGGGKPVRITPESSNESLPSWSRDGRAIYYNSDSTGVRSLWRRTWTGTEAGPAELVHQHACAGWVSPDGEFIYYVHSPNEPGLFRAPLSGGPEEAVLPTLSPGMWGSWAFGPHGIYFVDWTNHTERKDAWAQLLEPSGNVRRLFPVKHAIAFDSSVAVSPDGTWLAYSQLDRQGSDILLLRNWK